MKCPKPSLWYQFTSTEEQGHTFASVLVHPCEQKMKSEYLTSDYDACEQKIKKHHFTCAKYNMYLTKETQYQMLCKLMNL